MTKRPEALISARLGSLAGVLRTIAQVRAGKGKPGGDVTAVLRSWLEEVHAKRQTECGRKHVQRWLDEAGRCGHCGYDPAADPEPDNFGKIPVPDHDPGSPDEGRLPTRAAGEGRRVRALRLDRETDELIRDLARLRCTSASDLHRSILTAGLSTWLTVQREECRAMWRAEKRHIGPIGDICGHCGVPIQYETPQGSSITAVAGPELGGQ
jgi:hypothetical protein